MSSARDAPGTSPALSRRALLGAFAASTAGFVAGRVASPILPGPPAPSAPRAVPAQAAPQAVAPRPPTIPFHGPHQAGVATPLQDHLHLAAFDMLEGTVRPDLVTLLGDWSAAAADMTRGLPIRSSNGTDGPDGPAPDSGEALGLPARRLTITIGLGASLFEGDGVDRFSIASSRPQELGPLPSFVGDDLQQGWSGGDLAVQVCADDPQVVAHAIRNLARIATGRAAIRWSQVGFVRSSSGAVDAETPRNLMGFRDGTNNLLGADDRVIDQHVWLPPTSVPAWLAGGTYLVVRKIAMSLDDWDRLPVAAQETIVGRTKATGGPRSGGGEFSTPDFDARVDGALTIDRAAHVRLAHPSSNGGIRILRRGYNYVDGADARGCLGAGLVFISYQRSPSQFVAIQRSLVADRLNPFTRVIGSAVFVVPPGTSEGGYVGETLLG